MQEEYIDAALEAAQHGACVEMLQGLCERAMAERPEVDFYSGDREHQSWYGTLLNLYVIYSTIYGESPESLEFTPPEKSEVTADEDAWLRRVAWNSYQSWQKEMQERPE